MAKHNKKQQPGFYMANPKLGEVAMKMGDRPDPAMREESIFSKIKKGVRTGVRVLGELGVQGLDLLQGDPGNKGRTRGMQGGFGEAMRNARNAKNFENKFFDKSRENVRLGKTYFTLADVLDDSGAGFFKDDKRENYGQDTSSKNRRTGGGR